MRLYSVNELLTRSLVAFFKTFSFLFILQTLRKKEEKKEGERKKKKEKKNGGGGGGTILFGFFTDSVLVTRKLVLNAKTVSRTRTLQVQISVFTNLHQLQVTDLNFSLGHTAHSTYETEGERERMLSVN